MTSIGFSAQRITLGDVLLQLLQQGLLLATEGLKNLSTWSAHLRELHSWKLSQTQPSPLRRVNVRATASGKVPQSPRQQGITTGATGGRQGTPLATAPAASGQDQPLRQQFADQNSMQTALSKAEHWTKPPPQQPMLAYTASSQLQPHAVTPQGYQQGPTQGTASPQMGPVLQSSSLMTPDMATADDSGGSRQLSPSQRQAQSSALFAAVAAATQMQPKAGPDIGALTVYLTGVLTVYNSLADLSLSKLKLMLYA